METFKREVRLVSVHSCADGTFIVAPKYKQKPIEKGAAPIGLYTRLAIQSELGDLLNKAVK